jgi:hypothetical protein
VHGHTRANANEGECDRIVFSSEALPQYDFNGDTSYEQSFPSDRLIYRSTTVGRSVDLFET